VPPNDAVRTERPHDRLVRLVFGEDVETARGELMVVLPPAIAAAIDWSTLAIADPALLGPDLSERTADCLYQVKFGEREALLYVLLEHQSAEQDLFVVRALIYVTRIWERWMRLNEKATRVPPVIPILLTHASGGWRAPRRLADVIDFGDDALRPYIEPLLPALELRLLDDLTTVDDAALDAREMPVRGKLTLAALRDVSDAPDLTAALRDLAQRMEELSKADARDQAVRQAVFSYIPAARRRDDLQTITEAVRAAWPNKDEELVTTIQELIDSGEARGEAKGKAEGKAEALKRLLVRRFGVLPASVDLQLMEANAATLDRWLDLVLDVASPDELLAR
jgi:predicted transposase/invertase (TIGR01784 family)